MNLTSTLILSFIYDSLRNWWKIETMENVNIDPTLKSESLEGIKELTYL